MLDVCSIYKMTLAQLAWRSDDIYAHQAKLACLWKKMQWESPGQTNRHLKPFAKQLPYSTNAVYYWTLNIDQTMIACRERLEQSTHVVTNRLLADCLFSIGVCMIHHCSYDETTLRALSESLDEYSRCTHDRHYRIAILKRLIEMIKKPSDYILPVPNDDPLFGTPKSFHNGRYRTDIGMSANCILGFTSTCDDALKDFANLDAAYDDAFIMYLRHKDDMMPVWMHTGRLLFQYAPDI